MKTRVTAKQIKQEFGKRIVCLGTSHLMEMLKYLANSRHYTCGVYGWNADVLCFESNSNNFAITYGNRPFGDHSQEVYELSRRYENLIRTTDQNDVEDVAIQFLKEINDYLNTKY